MRIDAAAKQQTFDGWGTSLAWWSNVVGERRGEKGGAVLAHTQKIDTTLSPPGAFPDAIRNRVADLMFHPTKGLGLTIARYNIGGSGWATPDKGNLRPGGDIASFLGPDGTTYDWGLDAAQVWTLLAAKERGANLFEAFSNSPPYWMTISGRASGAVEASDDNLSPSKYGAFAEYLATVVRHFSDNHNITFATLDPFNEPSTNYWWAGNVQEGCHFDRASQNAFLPLMKAALDRAGVSPATQLSASDETNMRDALETLQAYTPQALASIAQINTHAYWGPSYPRLALGPAGALAAGKRMWQSEFGTGTAPVTAMADGLALAAQCAADLNLLKASAWVYWQAVEDLDGKDPTPWWGLAQLSFASGKGLRLGKQYWALWQHSAHVRPGATVLASPRPASLLAALAPGGEALVLVLTRADARDGATAVDVSSFLRGRPGVATVTRTSPSEDGEDAGSLPLPAEWGGRFRVRLAAESVTTVVVRAA